MAKERDERYMEYTEKFESMDASQLEIALENQRKNAGWTSSKAAYIAALRDVIDQRHQAEVEPTEPS